MEQRPYKEISIHAILAHYGAIVFSNDETDIILTWDGTMQYNVFAGRFDGRYDLIDTFFRDGGSVETARIVAADWYKEHSSFNPGP